MAKTTATDFRVTRVVPRVIGDDVVCECGSIMRVVDYVQFPEHRRWQFYKCLAHDNHITSALPLAVDRE